MLVSAAVPFLLLEPLPVNFTYWVFAAVLLSSSASAMGLFAAPNQTGIMNSLPPHRARRRRRDDRDVPELGVGALDRHLLLA